MHSKFTLLSLGTLFLVLISSFNTALTYTDVDLDRAENKAIKYISDKGIVQGYPDGSFKPDSKISRAEFTKIIVNSTNSNSAIQSVKDKNCFNDVLAEDWFSVYVCFAKSEGIIQGYPDNTFKPAQEISLVEALKIVYEADRSNPKLQDGEQWYDSYLKHFTTHNFIPQSVNSVTQKLTRMEIAEIIYRVDSETKNLPSADIELLTESTCQQDETNIADNIDESTLRQEWLNWTNAERTNLGLKPLIINTNLNITASDWSNTAKQRGYIDHKRDGQTAYYDYNMILNWFKDRGVTFSNQNTTTYSETIGWEYYSCKNGSDCTSDLISAIKSSFNFIMNEKGKEYRPHYNSLINKNFSNIGIGVAIDPNSKKYFLTVHYGTNLTSGNLASCT